jgi:hypothetical protein
MRPTAQTLALDDRPGVIRQNAEFAIIDRAIATVRTFVSHYDIVQAARNLTDILSDADGEGINRTRIARALWPLDDNPLKRFDKLTVPRNGPLTDDRAARFQRRTSHYRKVAEAAAELVPGWRREAILVRMFRNTSIDRVLTVLIEEGQAQLADPEAGWHELSWMIDQMVFYLSGRTDLTVHMKRIATMTGRYDLGAAKIVSGPEASWDKLLPYGPLDGDYALWEHFPPVPSVPILEQLLVPPFRREIAFTRQNRARRETIELDVRVWREIRLAVGPVGEPVRPGALFEARTRVDLIADGERLPLARSWFYLDTPEDVTTRLHGQEVTLHVDFGDAAPNGQDWKDLLMWKNLGVFPAGGPRYDLQPEHNYIAWRRVTPELCAELLGQSTANPYFEVGVYFAAEGGSPTVTPETSLGAVLERALRETGPSSMIDALLQETQRLIALVRMGLEQRRAEASILNARVIAAWGNCHD